MSNLGSPFPLPVPPRDDVEETTIAQENQMEVGEIQLDEVIRAHSLAPRVIQAHHRT